MRAKAVVLALALIGTLVNPGLAVNREELLSMWTNLVPFDEHAWTSSEGTSQGCISRPA